MTAVVMFYALVTLMWAAAMLCAARLAHLEHRPTDVRTALLAAVLAWTWPLILTAGLKAEDAIAIEAVQGNPYANVLVWRTEDDGNAAIKKLEELLHSQEVKDFISSEWPSGDVIPG